MEDSESQSLRSQRESSSLLGDYLQTELEADDDENQRVTSVEGYRRSIWKQIIFVFLCIITGGLFALLSRWFPLIQLHLTSSRTKFSTADKVLVRRKDKSFDIVDIRVFNDVNGVTQRVMEYRYQRYFLGNNGLFSKPNFQTSYPYSYIRENLFKYGDSSQHALNLSKYGPNVITVPVHSIPYLLINEALHPFFIFQAFSCVVWMLDDYYVYGTCIAITAMIAGGINVYQIRKNMQTLKQMATSSCEVDLVEPNGNSTVSTNSEDLAPGDIIEIRNNMVLPCDLLLVSGSCIMNESMLTGESVPVIKTIIPEHEEGVIYNPEGDGGKYTLFAGTSVVEARPREVNEQGVSFTGVRALVIRTGYNTTKGQLVRYILFPKPTKFKFYMDAFKFLAVLFAIALVGFAFSTFQFISFGAEPLEIALRGLDLFTIVIPPALPIALTTAQFFALQRLKKQESIYCISPPRISEAGKVEVMCFDKTGTLTEEGLDVLGVHASREAQFDAELTNETDKISSDFKSCLGACHGVSLVGGKPIGDPLDVKMFEFTKWKLEEPTGGQFSTVVYPLDQPEARLGIVKRYQFSSDLQRMTIIATNVLKDTLEIYTKGSPEMIKGLCNGKTLPADYDEILHKYTQAGYRVIACAHYVFNKGTSFDDIKQLPRSTLESNFTFLGFLLMNNQLKSDTTEIIDILKKARIRSVMVTGDNVLTAMNVAKKCGIVSSNKKLLLSKVTPERKVIWFDVNDPSNPSLSQVSMAESELAVTGEAFDIIFEAETTMQEMVLRRGQVFARMTPKQKTLLVGKFTEIYPTVGMCGDGSNDCGALKAANIGLSLSEAEASVAAPFTSKKPTIASVVALLREGRCALVTAFHLFKYMALYSLLQFAQVILLYNLGTTLGDWQFLWIDLVLILPLSFALSLTEAHKRLTKHRPISSLISKPVLVSLVGQLLIQIGCLVSIYFYLSTRSWYQPFEPNEDYEEDVVLLPDTTTIFTFSNFQYIMVVLSYSISYPFRKPVWTNKLLLITLGLQFIASTYMCLYPDKYTMDFMQLFPLPQTFRFIIFGAAMVNAVLSWCFERFFVVWLFTQYPHEKEEQEEK